MLNLIAKIISLIAFVILIVPSVLYLAGRIELDRVKSLMLIVTIIWFVSASFWMWNHDTDQTEDSSAT